MDLTTIIAVAHRQLLLIAQASGRPLTEIQTDAQQWLLTFEHQDGQWVTTQRTRLDAREMLKVVHAIEMMPAGDPRIARLTDTGVAIRDLVVRGAYAPEGSGSFSGDLGSSFRGMARGDAISVLRDAVNRNKRERDEAVASLRKHGYTGPEWEPTAYGHPTDVDDAFRTFRP